MHNIVVRYLRGVTDVLALDRQLCFALYSASRAVTAVYRPVLAELGITYPQYLVMLVLWERDGRGVQEICDELALDTGTLSPLLRRLEAAGLVERRRLSGDERRVEVRLTESGAAMRARATCIPERLVAAADFDGADLESLRDTLRELTRALRSADPAARTDEGEV